MVDATFEEGAEGSLALKAYAAEDLQIISTLVQDAVLTGADMTWRPKERRLAFLINRFRWEDAPRAEARSRPYERVRALLVIDGVLHVASQGVDKGDKDEVLSVLALDWTPGEDGAGSVTLVLAGDGAIRADVECLDVTLKDVTRPYLAPSRQMPTHPE
jgi:hypothetical protein